MTLYMPYVTEVTHRGETRHDIWSRLLLDRIIFIGDVISDDLANLVMAQLLYLESQDPEKDIFLYINSPGGSITAGMAIYDTMHYIRPEVATICVGSAGQMSAILLAAGAPGKRRILPSARVLLYQPFGRASGQASDVEIEAKEILRWKKRISEVLSEHTGRSGEQVAQDTERNQYLSAEEALAYGIVDEVIDARFTPGGKKKKKD
jgi:ATP-dependent Clp protease protease subunit